MEGDYTPEERIALLGAITGGRLLGRGGEGGSAGDGGAGGGGGGAPGGAGGAGGYVDHPVVTNYRRESALIALVVSVVGSIVATVIIHAF